MLDGLLQFPYSILVSILTLMVAFVIIRMVFRASFRVVKYFLFNSISGIITLYILNIIGFNFPLTPMNVVIVSFFGVPGLLGMKLF